MSYHNINCENLIFSIAVKIFIMTGALGPSMRKVFTVDD